MFRKSRSACHSYKQKENLWKNTVNYNHIFPQIFFYCYLRIKNIIKMRKYPSSVQLIHFRIKIFEVVHQNASKAERHRCEQLVQHLSYFLNYSHGRRSKN